MYNNIDYLLVRQKRAGKKIKIQTLARRLFPNASLASAVQSFSNMRTQKTKRITVDQVKVLCEELETTFEELFYE
jgi:DNA-binding Xre family transcriptional regulator